MKDTNQKTFDVAVVGEINADLIIKGNAVPVFGQVEQIVDIAHLVMGSSAVIFACGCAQLGLRTMFVGKVGDDLFGRFMIESMQDRGVDTSGTVIDAEIGTGLSVILASEGDRAILTYPGCIPELSFEDIDFSIIRKCRHLHLSSYFLLNKLRPDISKLFEKTKGLGLSVSLDTNYDPAEKWDNSVNKALRFVDVFLPNETEAKAITGEDNIHKAIKSLSQKVDTVAVKLGAQGAAGKTRNQPEFFQNTAVVQVEDTVGAGDSFDAGFVYGYLHEWPLVQTLKFAVACGSISTLKPGGTAGQAKAEEAQKFMEKHLTERN